MLGSAEIAILAAGLVAGVLLIAHGAKKQRARGEGGGRGVGPLLTGVAILALCAFAVVNSRGGKQEVSEANMMAAEKVDLANMETALLGWAAQDPDNRMLQLAARTTTMQLKAAFMEYWTDSDVPLETRAERRRLKVVAAMRDFYRATGMPAEQVEIETQNIDAAFRGAAGTPPTPGSEGR